MNTVFDPMVEESAVAAERWVSTALSRLPEGFMVVAQPAAVTIEGSNMPDRYEPDFLVKDPEGRALLVEVKPPIAMSWSNMARFVEINRHAQKSGEGFLVLVPGAHKESPWPFEAFNEVNISYGTDERSIVHAVVEALHKSLPTKRSSA